jgi:DNA-binding transcriptional LysR family regulator
VLLQDLARDVWILFAKRVHPLAHDAIMDAAQREAIVPRDVHDILTAKEALHLVSEHVGIAFLTKATPLRSGHEGVVVKPLLDDSLWFETCLVMRADNESRMVNEFARSFLRRHQPPHPKQMELAISA